MFKFKTSELSTENQFTYWEKKILNLRTKILNSRNKKKEILDFNILVDLISNDVELSDIDCINLLNKVRCIIEVYKITSINKFKENTSNF